MITIPYDLSGTYPPEVTELLKQLQENYNYDDELDEFYGDSVRYGCDCGCGGDSLSDSYDDLYEERAEILDELHQLGYDVASNPESDEDLESD